MEILNTGWTLPFNAVNVFCFLAIIVLIGVAVTLISVGISEAFSITIISWLITSACVVSILIAFLIWNGEKTYHIYLDDVTLKELETEYEPFEIDGLVVKCTKKGGADGRGNGSDDRHARSQIQD